LGKKIVSGKKIVGKRVSGEIHTLQRHGIDKGDNMLLADVYGVGNVLTERLAKAGFLTVGDVKKNPEKALEVEGFGPQKLAVLGIKVPKKQKSVKKQKMEVKTGEKEKKVILPFDKMLIFKGNITGKLVGEAPKDIKDIRIKQEHGEWVSIKVGKGDVVLQSDGDKAIVYFKDGTKKEYYKYDWPNKLILSEVPLPFLESRDSKSVTPSIFITVATKSLKNVARETTQAIAKTLPKERRRIYEDPPDDLLAYMASGAQVEVTEDKMIITFPDPVAKVESVVLDRNGKTGEIELIHRSIPNKEVKVVYDKNNKVMNFYYDGRKIDEDTKATRGKESMVEYYDALYKKIRNIGLSTEMQGIGTSKKSGGETSKEQEKMVESKMEDKRDNIVKTLESDDKFAVTVERKKYGKWYEYKKYPRVWVSNDHTKIRVYIPKRLRGGREATEGYVGVDIDDIDNIQIVPDKYGDEEKLKEYARIHGDDLKRLARIYKAEVDAMRMDGVKKVIEYYRKALRGPKTDRSGLVKLEGDKFMGWDVKSGKNYVYSITRHPNGKVTITAHLITDKQLSREDFKEILAMHSTEKSKMIPPNYSKLKQYGVTDFSIVIMSNDEKDAENLLQKKIDIIKKYG